METVDTSELLEKLNEIIAIQNDVHEELLNIAQYDNIQNIGILILCMLLAFIIGVLLVQLWKR